MPSRVSNAGAVAGTGTAAKITEGRRFSELEGIRGVAALLVVFYHLPYWHPFIHAVPFVDNGLMMVQLFFVLSGFVICGAYRSRITDPRALIDFQILRFGRLYPVHLLFLLFFLAVEFVKLYLASKHDLHSNNGAPFDHNNWTAFVQQLLLVHSIGPTGNALTFNTPSWSIGVEFYIYLLFAVIAMTCARYFVALSIAIGTLSFALLAWGGLPDDYALVLMGGAGFFLGCLVQIGSSTRTGTTRHLLALVIVLLAVYLCMPLGPASKMLIYPLSALLIYATVTSDDGHARRMLRSAPLAWLGRISYSVYMSHLAMIWIVSQIVRFALNPPQAQSPNGHVDSQLTGLEAIAACGLVLVTTLGVATLVCRYVEEPLRSATRRWVESRKQHDASPPVTDGRR